MSLLPLLQRQPTAVPRDTAPTATPERRPVDTPRDQFAASLATARADRAPDAERSPRTSSRNPANVSRRDGDTATERADTFAEQRAQLQHVMLSGAMKFAVTRGQGDGAPAVPPTDAAVVADAAPMDADLSAMVPMVVPNVGGAVMDTEAASPIAAFDAAQAQADEMPIAPAIATSADDTHASMPAPTDAPVVSIDVNADAAATMAAMQLLQALPIAPVEMPAPATRPDGSDDTAAETPTAPDRRSAQRASLPARIETMLLEDHFDAPAAALAATPTGATTAAPGTATSTASAAAAGRAAAGSSIDVTHIESDLAKLDPEFRDRLQKVIDRMRADFGHTVTVVETVRSQARQEALFAQGRTAPGPVVTWTRNSQHGKGLAADLLVDGAWQNPEGYAHLATVAKQEGLRTLGARDPGHLELPSDGAVSGDTLGALLGDLQGDAGDAARQLRADVHGGHGSQAREVAMAQVANVAQVARVATVATVASVAKVAEVARPGSDAPAATSDAFSPLAVSGVPPAALGSDAASVMRVATPAGTVNMADRISHLLDLQAAQDAKPLNSVLLRMGDAGGIEDQIRIDTRGTSVDARLGLGNAQQAAALSDRVGELREALERRGLTAEGVRVQATTAPRGTDSATFSRAVAPTLELAALRAAADSQAQGNLRDQTTRDQAQRDALAREQARHTPRPSTDDARHRSRREPPEERR